MALALAVNEPSAPVTPRFALKRISPLPSEAPPSSSALRTTFKAPIAGFGSPLIVAPISISLAAINVKLTSPLPSSLRMGALTTIFPASSAPAPNVSITTFVSLSSCRLIRFAPISELFPFGVNVAGPSLFVRVPRPATIVMLYGSNNHVPGAPKVAPAEPDAPVALSQ